MNYEETLEYMFDSLPMYHRIGQAAYKADITNTVKLMDHLGHPENGFRSIHVAGTNGKGSVSHFLASILGKAGYKVGLYTSPHLVDFRERIRINGEMIPKEEVVEFIEKHQNFLSSLGLSFFEMTVGLAFDYFARNKVDVAVVEVGMGGRLDSTNVITPDLSVITNISFDHTQFLGDTLAKIAGEKAGIIKAGIPVVIGETHPETKPVFEAKAAELGSEIVFADRHYEIIVNETQRIEQARFHADNDAGFSFDVLRNGERYLSSISTPMGGWYQCKNLATLMQSLEILRKVGYHISESQIANGIANVIADTGLHGRWETIGKNPATVCETAHNEAGIASMIEKLKTVGRKELRIVYGCVNDKDYRKIVGMLPKEAHYYVTKPSVPRGLDAETLAESMEDAGLRCRIFETCAQAIEAARAEADPADLVLITGSIYLVADAMAEKK